MEPQKKKRTRKSQRPWGKDVKHFSNERDRQATRRAIDKEQFDKIPSKKRTREDDPWNWD